MMNKHKSNRTRFMGGSPASSLSLAVAFACTLMGGVSHAAVDVANIPLKMAETPAPNILFILDDSSSMGLVAMPANVRDQAGGDNAGRYITGRNNLQNDIQDKSYVNNTIYYNPHKEYLGWRIADGGRLPDIPATTACAHPDWLANMGQPAPSNPAAPSCSLNLQGSTQTFFVPNVANPSTTNNSSFDRYELTGAATACRRTWNGNGWTACNNNPVSTFTWSLPDGSTLTRTLAEEWQNYANWYSYHRSRMKVAKAGASEAFAELGRYYRVGFDRINQGTTNTPNIPIPVNNEGGLFDGDNKAAWFARLHQIGSGSGQGTPLRNALKRAGEYYSRTDASGPYGPESGNEQLACRQNFSILTTDGHWNGGNPSGIGDADNTAGPTVNGPDGQSYTYQPANPYMASNNESTLADVAMHYWKNDLRDLANIVPTSASPAFWQHMVTFGVSIGLRGELDPATDLPALRDGSKTWPNPITSGEGPARIDDLWHAAVNGRGEFIVADDSEAFAKGLQDALATIANMTASRSNVSANSTALRAGTNVFQASYIGGDWSGSLKALPVVDGSISDTPTWSASVQYTGSGGGNRSVYTEGTGNTPANFPTTAQSDALNDVVINGSAATHVTDYIRGLQLHEERNGGPFRNRPIGNTLGDIVYSAPAYVEGPDPAEGQDRKNTVFIGANDGMLHAFDAADGNERFAYVPGGLNLNHLRAYADPDYPHYFSVDGPIVVSTRQQTPDKNILVGALGRGGKGLFAMDVTDPDNPTVLWDHTWSDVAGGALDANGTSGWAATDKAYMAHIINAPFITKLDDNTPVVITSGGLHLTSTRAATEVDAASLFVINLETGAIIRRIDVPASSGTNPPALLGDGGNSLSAPRGWDSDRNGTADLIYAGDLQGNVWKFNLNANNANQTTVRMFTAVDANNKRQPITGGLTIAVNPATYERMVLFGTGQFLTENDPGDLSVQSLYGLIDGTGNNYLPITRSSQPNRNELTRRSIVAQTTASGRVVRTFEPSGSELEENTKGWYIDLVVNNQPDGERVVGQARNEAGVLLINSGIPSGDPCDPTGSGFIYALDAFTGASLGSPYFDLDDDGVFDDDDTVDGTVPGAIGHDNMLTDSLTLMDDDGTGKLVSGDHGADTAETGIKSQIATGRISWRELMGN